MTEKRGENVVGIGMFPIYNRVLIFWQGNPSSLDYDDVITLCC